MKELQATMFYREECDMLYQLSDAEIATLFRAKTQYVFNGEFPEFEQGSRCALLWTLMQQKADANRTNYENTCRRNADAAKKRWELNKAMQAEFAKAHNLNANFFGDGNDNDADDNADTDDEKPP